MIPVEIILYSGEDTWWFLSWAGSPSKPCVFPFKYHGVLFTDCTFGWCSTKVDDDGKHIKGNQGDCGPECPTGDEGWVTDESLSVKHQHSET